MASVSCFTGKEEDVEVGLQYFGKRWLNPALGRWVSADPLAVHGLGGDLNLYAYVRSRLLKATDPLGLEEVPEPGGAQIKSAETGPSGEKIEFYDMTISNTGYLTVPEEAPAPPPLPSVEEQGAGKAPERFGVTCPNDCHDADSVATGEWTGMGPAPDHPESTLSGAIQSVVTALPGTGTIALTIRAADDMDRGEAGSALWSLGGAALTMAPTASLGVESATELDIAYDFYRGAGWSAERSAQHVFSGIDFAESVEVVDLAAGQQFSQHVLNGRVGNYFAQPGVPAADLGIAPMGRTEMLFEVQQSTQALRSTAAQTVDTWTVPGQAIPVEGGGAQFFVPNQSALTVAF